MSARLCTVCGGAIRIARRVLVVKGGELRGANVCLRCARSALHIVLAQPVAKCSSCDKPAVRCAAHASRDVNRDRAAVVADVAKRLRAYIEGAKTWGQEAGGLGGRDYDYQRGRIEGLEAALELVRGGRQ